MDQERLAASLDEESKSGRSDEALYRAVASRDPRFDGRFFTAVLTTGIYCRPICPARTPRRENMRFFLSAAAAELAGFRACRRCRPEAAPGSAAWVGRSAIVARALRLIDAGALEELDLETFAAQLGVGGRHLRRLFLEEIGAPPRAVAETRRLHLARRLIEGSDLPMRDVAFAAGFHSIRRFNDAVRKSFGRAPKLLRAEARAHEGVAAAVQGASDARQPGATDGRPGVIGPGGFDIHRRAATTDGRPRAATKAQPRRSPSDRIDLRLEASSPFDWAQMIAFLAPRAIPGVEVIREDEIRRSLLVDGSPILIEIRPEKARALKMTARGVRPESILALVDRARRALDLDTDTRRIARDLRTAGSAPSSSSTRWDDREAPTPGSRAASTASIAGPRIDRLFGAAAPRVPGAWDPFEVTIRAILGQQVQVSVASKLAGRLVEALGDPLPEALRTEGGPVQIFPSPARIASVERSPLAIPGQRWNAIATLAKEISQGRIDFRDGPAARESLALLPGFGPWTLEYVAMRALGDPDAFPAGDLGIRRALGDVTEPVARRISERWRPWRSYAAMAIWNP